MTRVFQKKPKVFQQYQACSIQNVMKGCHCGARRKTACQRTRSQDGKIAYSEQQTVKSRADGEWLPAKFSGISLKGQNLEEVN